MKKICWNERMKRRGGGGINNEGCKGVFYSAASGSI